MKQFLSITIICLLAVACGPTPQVDGANSKGGTSAVIDTLNGPQEIMDGEGNLLMKGDMRDAKRHGVWTSYNKTGGVKSRSEYVNGVLQGPSIVFHENGNVFYTGDYKDGKPIGEWKYYDRDGELVANMEHDSTGVIHDHKGQ